MRIVFIISILCFLFSSLKCKRPNAPEIKRSEKILPAGTVQQKKIPQPVVSYHVQPLNKETVAWLRTIQSDDSLKIMLALNRVDRKHLFRQDSLVVPDIFTESLNTYSPFPDSMPKLKTIHKIIFFSYSLQAFATYENGVLIRWGPVSMGKRSTPTPAGFFYTNWKSIQTTSTVNSEWIMNWYFNLDNFLGMSMHEYDLPGYPASHACIRLLADDAYWFYHWADQWILKDDNTILAYGTPAIVFGKYSFDKIKPWRALTENKDVPRISSEELFNEVILFFPVILDRLEQRDSLSKKFLM